MKLIKIALGVVALGIFTLFASYLAYKLWQIGSFIFEGAKSLEATTYVPLTLTLLTAISGLAVTLWTQARARTRAIEEAHRDKKVEIYMGLLTFIKELQLSVKDQFSEMRVAEDDMVLRMATFRTEMTLWASPKVLLAFDAMIHPREDDPKDILLKIDPLYKAMRKDIGLGNNGLKPDFFAKSMLTDPSELDR